MEKRDFLKEVTPALEGAIQKLNKLNRVIMFALERKQRYTDPKNIAHLSNEYLVYRMLQISQTLQAFLDEHQDKEKYIYPEETITVAGTELQIDPTASDAVFTVRLCSRCNAEIPQDSTALRCKQCSTLP